MKEIKLELKPLIKKLEIFTKRGAMGEFSGEYKSVFKGRGLEFEEYRPYDSGHDDASKIDWKASLRAWKHRMPTLTPSSRKLTPPKPSESNRNCGPIAASIPKPWCASCIFLKMALGTELKYALLSNPERMR